MKLLAIETTEKHGSIAFFGNELLLLSLLLPESQRSAQSLVPTIRSGLMQLSWSPQDLTHVAVAIGPGSFTGLRVGLTTARMLAYATGAKLVGVNTLQAIAAMIPNVDSDVVLSTVMDAQRGDISAQFFKPVPNQVPQCLSDIELLSFENWWKKTEKFEKTLVAGPILSKILSQKPDNVGLADEKCWCPTSEGVMRVALDRIARNDCDDLWTLQPFYSRLSAAEEKKLAQDMPAS